MKKLVYLFIVLFVGTYGLYGQDCATGYCPSTIVVHHKIGDLSAVSGDITYNVVKITATASPTCWITQNLGAPSTPTANTDNGTSYVGWVYQAGLKQGNVSGTFTNFVHGMTLTSSDTWLPSTDPCTLTLGSAWHVPTATQYIQGGSVAWAASPKYNYNGTLFYWATGSSAWANSGWTNSVQAYHVQDYGYNTVQIRYYTASSGGAQYYNGYNTDVITMPVRCVKLVTQ